MTEVAHNLTGVPKPRTGEDDGPQCDYEALPRDPRGNLDPRGLTAVVAQLGLEQTANGIIGGECQRCLGSLMGVPGGPIERPTECLRLRPDGAA